MATQLKGWTGPGWVTTALTVAITVIVTGASLLSSPPVQAVHVAPAPFELDGDPTKVGMLDDWNSVFELPSPYPTPRGTPVVGAGETFVVDGANLPGGKETSAWNGSNKDIDLISTWEYKSAKVVPDKDNITNAYAKAYSVDHDGNPATPNHLWIYFGADRYANNGDAALGFWFFRNNVALAPNGQFSGEHAVGDVLVQVDFVSGGKSSEVQIFEWVGSGGDFGALEEIQFGASNGAEVCTSADDACAITNEMATDSPWAYSPKAGSEDVFPAESFFEAAIDVTALIGEVCFSSFMAETRSSHSETAELKDFALGDFDLCSIDVEKVCVADSQIVNPADETFTTTHMVTITNDGFGGSLYNVELSDTLTTADKTCEIKSIVSSPGGATGLSGVGFVFDDASDSVQVAESLSGTVTVELECTTPDNPFRNAVAVKSSSFQGAPQDVTDSDTETTEEAGVCEADLNVGLALNKWCQGDDGGTSNPNPYYGDGTANAENPLELSVFLKPPNYVPEVCVDIELSNTSSNQRMVIDTLADSDLGNLLPMGGLTLNPLGTAGDKYSVSRCYTPTAPDGADGSPINPALAMYTDSVSATGHGKLDNAPASAGPVTATCGLCPTCDCPPQD